jgi:hypothetical protein
MYEELDTIILLFEKIINNNSLIDSKEIFDNKIKVLEDYIIKLKELSSHKVDNIIESSTNMDDFQNSDELNNTELKELKKEKEKKIKSKKNNLTYRDIKIECFDIDIDFINNCLSMRNIIGDIKLFKKMYLDNTPKEFYPIRHIKKKFEYWNDGHMNEDDTNGTYILNTIFKNIEYCYLKVNSTDNYIKSVEEFLENENYISNLHNEKNKQLFLKKIIPIINI